ncbi:ATP-dependent DNA ligase [Bradyrhizobium elkanii]|nr:ATP-dependent DNA ligase [Bradyrhizobium elkanii]MCS3972534.1 ATP-dependent DNA ligase [Bradyrhizobium japonicum]
MQFSESFEIDGREMFTHACKVGLEDVVSKVRDSVYASGRGDNWVKKTCAQRETLTIAGYALDEGKWDGMYLARRRGDDLIYAGKVDHGFDKSRTKASGSNRGSSPKSSTAPNPPRERCGIHSSKACARTSRAWYARPPGADRAELLPRPDCAAQRPGN